jgi:hypothetical protein
VAGGGADGAPDANSEPAAKPASWTGFLIASGFFATIFGVVGTFAESWLKSDQQEVCAQAHATMLDDRLNPDVPQQLRAQYLQKQAKIAIECARLGDEL